MPSAIEILERDGHVAIPRKELMCWRDFATLKYLAWWNRPLINVRKKELPVISCCSGKKGELGGKIYEILTRPKMQEFYDQYMSEVYLAMSRIRYMRKGEEEPLHRDTFSNDKTLIASMPLGNCKGGMLGIKGNSEVEYPCKKGWIYFFKPNQQHYVSEVKTSLRENIAWMISSEKPRWIRKGF